MPRQISFSRLSTIASPGLSELKDRVLSLRLKLIETRTVRLIGLAALVLFFVQRPGLRAQAKEAPRLDRAVELAPLLEKLNG